MRITVNLSAYLSSLSTYIPALMLIGGGALPLVGGAALLLVGGGVGSLVHCPAFWSVTSLAAQGDTEDHKLKCRTALR